MTLTDARAHVGADVIRYRAGYAVARGVLTGVGKHRTQLVYVRFEGRKNSVGIDPRLLELAE